MDTDRVQGETTGEPAWWQRSSSDKLAQAFLLIQDVVNTLPAGRGNELSKKLDATRAALLCAAGRIGKRD